MPWKKQTQIFSNLICDDFDMIGMTVYGDIYVQYNKSLICEPFETFKAIMLYMVMNIPWWQVITIVLSKFMCESCIGKKNELSFHSANRWKSSADSLLTAWYVFISFLFIKPFFQRKQRHIFTLYVIPPHWHTTGSWNPSLSKTRTYLFYIVNSMAADALASFVAGGISNHDIDLIKSR